MRLPEQEPINYCLEHLQTPEKEYQVRFAALTISGPPGSGTSSVSEQVTKAYSIEKPIFHAGELMRENQRARTGEEIIGAHERDVKEDRDIDGWTRDEILDSSIEAPIIIEAQLGGWVATKTVEEIGELLPPVFRVLLTATSQERARRIQRREQDKGNTYSIDEIKKLTRERERKNRQAWREAHPQLKGIDPLDPRKNIDENGEALYDLIIDTTNLSVEKVVEKINSVLLDKGLIQEI